ncbi:MAG TPA: ribonuclease domain-containing protein [Geminicoccaceae bacterium]|nr:ribonuclease domain-containing protein [Geminicoccus sp.]HMU49810.1 ribonuclease domain-containing protein [Geminicoccaceae bacterium]
MYRLARLALLALLLALPALASDAALESFARGIGLRDVAGFVETVTELRRSGRLPDRYLTKDEAEDLGWRPGSDLCDVAPDGSIGGDRFGNRERRLPERQGRRWREADLDFDCGRRGARRLVWSNDGLIYVTVDHYDSFSKVPP